MHFKWVIKVLGQSNKTLSDGFLKIENVFQGGPEEPMLLSSFSKEVPGVAAI